MSQHVVNAVARPLSTKGALNDLRKNGKIPGIMYDRTGKTTTIALDVREFAKSTVGVSESTIITLNIDGKETECFIKDRQLHWLSASLVHVDFFAIDRNKIMRVKVPVHLVGIAVGVREGGILENPVHELEVECMPKDVPEKFLIDITELHANHSIHVRDIPRSEAVRVLANPDQVVALVKYAKAEVVEAVEEVAPVAGAAVPGAAPGTPEAPGGAKAGATKAPGAAPAAAEKK